MKARKLIEGLSRLPRRTVDAHLDAHLRGVIERTTAAAQYASTAEAKGRASRLPRIALFIAIPAVAAVVTSVTVVTLISEPKVAPVAMVVTNLPQEQPILFTEEEPLQSNTVTAGTEAQQDPLDAARADLVVVLEGVPGVPVKGVMNLSIHDQLAGGGSNITRWVQNEPAIVFESVPAVECNIAAYLHGYMHTHSTFSLSGHAGEAVTNVMTLRPAAAISGRVVDFTTHAPVPSASVSTVSYTLTNSSAAGADTFTHVCLTNDVMADAGGTFILPHVQDNIQVLCVSHEEYFPQTFQVNAAAAVGTPIVLELKRPGRVFGTVTDQSGNVVSGCLVSCMPLVSPFSSDNPPRHSSTNTEANGHYEFPCVRAADSVSLSASTRSAHASRSVRLEPLENKRVDIVLKAVKNVKRQQGYIHITAREFEGAPVTNAGIMIFCDGGRYASRLSDCMSQLGTCVFPLDPGRCTLILSCREKPGACATNVLVTCGTTTDVHMVTAAAFSYIKGHARRSNGQPATGMQLSVRYMPIYGIVNFRGMTDKDDGSFSVCVIDCEGPYRFCSLSPGDDGAQIESPLGDVMPGDDITLLFKPYTRISATPLVTNSLTALRFVECELAESPEGKAVEHTYFSGGTAHHHYCISSAGYYYLRLRARGYEPIVIQRRFSPDEDIDLGTLYFVPLSTTNAP